MAIYSKNDDEKRKGFYFILIQPLFEARAKKCKKIVGFLEYGRTWYFAFEIY